MEEQVKRYYELKQLQKKVEQELSALRLDITNYCDVRGIAGWETGDYKVKLVFQERKEYDDGKLYDSLPDPAVWRMLSKADPAKIASLLKLKVISDHTIETAVIRKTVTLLQVEKK